jgi:hypothetical protein
LPIPPHTQGQPASPRASSSYANEYTPREKTATTSSYYDPTSDSGDRRPSESSGYREPRQHTPQVRAMMIILEWNQLLTLFRRLESHIPIRHLLLTRRNFTTERIPHR